MKRQSVKANRNNIKIKQFNHALWAKSVIPDTVQVYKTKKSCVTEIKEIN